MRESRHGERYRALSPEMAQSISALLLSTGLPKCRGIVCDRHNYNDLECWVIPRNGDATAQEYKEKEAVARLRRCVSNFWWVDRRNGW